MCVMPQAETNLTHFHRFLETSTFNTYNTRNHEHKHYGHLKVLPPVHLPAVEKLPEPNQDRVLCFSWVSIIRNNLQDFDQNTKETEADRKQNVNFD